MTRDEDVKEIFEARLRFYEAGAHLHHRLYMVAPPGYDLEDHLNDARMYQMQARALLMTEPELEAVDKAAKGALAAAVGDEVDRRRQLTRHQGMQEAAVRTKARRDRKVRVESVRGVRREGVER